MAESWACRNSFERLIFKPEWRRYGRSAGYRRNHTIIENAEKVIAFWDRTGRGTAHSIQLAKEKKIPVLIVPFSKSTKQSGLLNQKELMQRVAF